MSKYYPRNRADLQKVSFEFKDNERRLYTIEDSQGMTVAFIHLQTKYINQRLELIYLLNWSLLGEQMSRQEREYIRNLFKNIVNILTYDMQTTYSANINERIDYPFFKELYKLTYVKEK